MVVAGCCRLCRLGGSLSCSLRLVGGWSLTRASGGVSRGGGLLASFSCLLVLSLGSGCNTKYCVTNLVIDLNIGY